MPNETALSPIDYYIQGSEELIALLENKLKARKLKVARYRLEAIRRASGLSGLRAYASARWPA